MLKFMVLLELIFVYDARYGLRFFFFAYEYSVVSALFVET